MIYETLIAVPTGSKQISQIKQGEEVLSASTQLIHGKVEFAWQASKVGYSSGTGGDSHQAMMFYIELSGGRQLICNAVQPVLLANGKYTIAGKLGYGKSLLDGNGNGVPIEYVAAGAYHGGVHGIATIAPWKNNPDGHLLLAEGVVVGDFQMQLFFDQLPDSMKEL